MCGSGANFIYVEGEAIGNVEEEGNRVVSVERKREMIVKGGERDWESLERER